MQSWRRHGRRKRRHHRAGAQHAKKDRRLLRRGCSADCDNIARANTVALQAGGHAVHQRVELGKAEPPLALHQRELLRPCGRVLADHVGDAAKRPLGHRRLRLLVERYFAASPSRSISAFSLTNVSAAHLR